MATPTPTMNAGSGDGSIIMQTYTLTTGDPTGVAFEIPEYADICFTATGTWGGATLVVEGSNDNTNFIGLSNAAGGAAISKTANGAATVIERPRYMRPNLSVVGSGASLTVIACLRRANPMRT